MPLLINQDKTNIKDFENKIVFAPNGFGKTQFSIFLRDYLTRQNKTVGFYTRREIDELIRITDKHLFIGNAASLLKRINDIENLINNNIIFEEAANELNIKVSDYYLNSYFLSKYKITQRTTIRKTFETISSLFVTDGAELMRDDLYKTDNVLSLNLYNRAVKVIQSTADFLVSEKSNITMSEDLLEALNNLREYVISSKTKQCPLCGQNYKDNDELFSKISEMISSYNSQESNSLATELSSIDLEIKALLRKKKATYLKEVFILNDYRNLSPYQILVEYVNFCNSFDNIFANRIAFLEIEIDGQKEKVIDIANDYLKNSNHLELERKTIKKLGTGFSNFVLSEINKLLDLDDNGLILSETLDTISFKDNGQTIKKKCYDYFSESQLKRIGLVLLRGYIIYLDYDYLILYDPIDSYDDYYLNIACDYISDTLDESGNTKWYLFTNNYNCLMNLASSKNNREFVIYNDNPDILFSNSSKPPLKIKCKSKDVNALNINEMLLMSAYACKHPGVKTLKQSDFDSASLPFLAFVVILRNMRDIVHNHFDGITVGYACPSFSEMVTKHIEHNFMHYDPITSISTAMRDLFYVYAKILNPDNVNLLLFRSNLNNAVGERTITLKRHFASFKGSKLLNLIFYKVLALSYLKYLIEEKMINGLSKLGINVSSIVKKNGLGSKIGEAKKKASKDPVAVTLVSKIEMIHSKHRALINEFDHALARMYPPYLSTSIKDMKKLKDDIDSI